MKFFVASVLFFLSLNTFAKKSDSTKNSGNSNARESFLLTFEDFKRLPYEQKIVYVNFLSKVSEILESQNNEDKEVLPKDLESAFWQRPPSMWQRLMQIAVPEADAEDLSATTSDPSSQQGVPPAPTEQAKPIKDQKKKSEHEEKSKKNKKRAAELKEFGKRENNAKQSMREDSQRKLFLNESHAEAKKTEQKKTKYSRKTGAVCLFGNRGSRYVENPNPQGKNPYCPPPRNTVNTKVCKGTATPNYLCPSFGMTLGVSDNQENNSFCIPLYSDKGLTDLSQRCSKLLSDLRGKLQANRDLYEQQTAELQKHFDEFKRFGNDHDSKFSIEAYCAKNNAANEGRQSQECNSLLAEIENLRNKGIALNPPQNKESKDATPPATSPANEPSQPAEPTVHSI